MPNCFIRPFYEFPLVALRRISALLGAALIPLSYYTMRHLGHSRSAATMAAGLIMLGNWDKICCVEGVQKYAETSFFIREWIGYPIKICYT